MDLSFPQGSSVNDGIPSDTYLGDQFKLRLPGIIIIIIITVYSQIQIEKWKGDKRGYPFLVYLLIIKYIKK